MKKSLIALAVLAAAGTASAQSSVTLFGIVDATLQRVSNSGGGSVTRLTNSGYNSSRLGFRGTEDLGGGMSASFWLEAGVSNDDGQGAGTSATNSALPPVLAAPPPAGTVVTVPAAGLRPGQQGLTFNRRSTVSLAGGWGELRLGRDYTPQFWNLTIFDPFGTNGAGTTQTLNSIITGTTAVRASNSIGYFLPGNLGGFYGQIQHYRGENDSRATFPLVTAAGALGATPVGSFEDQGNGWGIRVGYAAGPFNVAVATSRTDNAVAALVGGVPAAVEAQVKQSNIGGQWDFGVAKLMGHYSWDELGGVDGRGWLIGGLIPVGAGEIRLAYSTYETELGVAGVTDPRARKIALGYVHYLSKRTAVYTTYARVRNNATSAAPAVAGAATGPAAGGSSSAFDLGIRHSF